jgi:putative two-component system response regulator
VMVTGRDDPEMAGRALEIGAYGYITKPFAPNELLIDLANALHRRKLEADRRTYEMRLEDTVRERTNELRLAYVETVARLGRAIEFHDSETGEHVERVGTYSHAIAIELGFDAAHAERLRLAAPLHDVGKIAVREEILRKRGPLDRDEWEEMERHTELGYELLGGSGNELLELAATIAWTHHERWDGRGYPRRLAGEDIPLDGRIVSVADAFDALISDRPYRAAMSLAEARALLIAERGAAFDTNVVDALLGQSR